jgi:hypothetical protein
MITLPNGAEWHNDLGMNNSEEAVKWVNENLMQFENQDLKTMETVDRHNGLQPLTRIKTQTYQNLGFTMVLSRTYPSVMSCAGVTANYNLTKDGE